MPNIYDEPQFFSAYAQMPRSKAGLAAAGEWSQLRPLFPNLTGKQVLDLGCGYGWHCRYAAEAGAAGVLGIDQSEKMIAKAKALTASERIVYQVCSLENFSYPANTFDLVLSNLALHYVADLAKVYRKVLGALKPGGHFLFNIEHPVFTAGVNEDWIRDEAGTPLYWPVDHYYSPGPRETLFLGQKVEKQHHTLTQILNPLLQLGFRLEVVEEATPPKEMLGLPGMADELRRPMMLLVSAVK